MHAYEEKDFKILIVDENVQFRNTLASCLRLQGYNVEFATGGFHLLHVLETYKDYCLLIMHEDMLDMSAEEIILLIRTNKTKKDLPILFISQNKDNEEICEMIFKGANEFIFKTANFQPIIERAKKYFTLLKNS
jgi:response regulator RpfG family c-di-GMP phosphodiesterase